jgi:peptidoglycan/LPS O-acetylase OafA/YrhL
MIGGMQRHSALLFVVFCALAGLAPEAQAYLDPSTGSMILSAVVGLFATLGLALKTYWYKFRNLLIRRPEPAPETQRDATHQDWTNRSVADSGQGNRPS